MKAFKVDNTKLKAAYIRRRKIAKKQQYKNWNSLLSFASANPLMEASKESNIFCDFDSTSGIFTKKHIFTKLLTLGSLF